MLMLKKAELERTLERGGRPAAPRRMPLPQIDEQGALSDYDVVVKAAPAQPYLSLQAHLPGHGRRRRDAARGRPRGNVAAASDRTSDKLVVVAYSDFEDEDLDLEVGFGLARGDQSAVALSGGVEMTLSELPAVETLATLVRSGRSPGAYRLRRARPLDGCEPLPDLRPAREVFLEPPFSGATTGRRRHGNPVPGDPGRLTPAPPPRRPHLPAGLTFATWSEALPATHDLVPDPRRARC